MSTRVEITSVTGLSDPTISLVAADQQGLLKFNPDHRVGNVYDMVITEQALVVNTYEGTPSKNTVASQQHFRAEIGDSQKKLRPKLSNRSCLSFDQSYWTRTLGQIEIQMKLEAKHGNLSQKYDLFTGSGFGVIQAFWGALGRDSVSLKNWYLNRFRKSISPGILKKTGKGAISFLFGTDSERLPIKQAKKEVKRLFSVDGRDLLIRDLSSDVFIPIQDISGNTFVINKIDFGTMPIHEAVSAAIFDPVYFKADSKSVKQMGVLNGDVAKNNDYLLRKNNPTMGIDSIGCPVRVYNKGNAEMPREALALKAIDRKHLVDLKISEEVGAYNNRYECTPIDEVYQFSTSEKAIRVALMSADKVQV